MADRRRLALRLRQAAETKLAEVDDKIAQLSIMRDTLAQVIAAGWRDLAECAAIWSAASG